MATFVSNKQFQYVTRRITNDFAIQRRLARRCFSTRSRRMPVYTHADYTLNLPAKHSFPMHRYQLVANQVSALDSIIEMKTQVRLATIQEIKLVHTEKFVDDFIQGRFNKKEMLKIGFPWSQDLVRRTLRITGATLQATDDVLSGLQQGLMRVIMRCLARVIEGYQDY